MSNYKMVVYANKFGDIIEFVAEYPTLKGVIGTGATEEEAIFDLKINAQENIRALIQEGMKVPDPDIFDNSDDYSGKLSLRVSKTLHQKMVERAKLEGVSLNAFMSEGLSAFTYREMDVQIKKYRLK